MITCKEVAKLLSDSMEHELSLWQKISMRTHLMMCGMCRSYRRQLLALRKILEGYSAIENPEARGLRLAEHTRERIKRILKEQISPHDDDENMI